MNVGMWDLSGFFLSTNRATGMVNVSHSSLNTIVGPKCLCLQCYESSMVLEIGVTLVPDCMQIHSGFGFV
jgi:hypothetical protein